ncbi:MAG: PTS fructose transporter subunit IIC [Erysipelotrichaceae bacterium]|nr:PTS fructose transporter subunit IIC [Erysipelotrichaceae bacterium]
MKFKDLRKHVLTGISFLIPMVVMAGILGAFQKMYKWDGVPLSEPTIKGLNYSGYSILKISDYFHMLGEMNSNGFNWAYAFLCAGIAFSISDRPGIVPGFAIGYFAGGPTKTGFVGAMLMGFVVGYFVNWVKSWKLPKALQGLMPVLIIPVLGTMFATFLFFGVLMKPLSLLMIAFQKWIESLSTGSLFVVGAVIGACMGFDMGGPINKTASMAANALYADHPEIDGIGAAAETAKIIGGMTPAIGMGLAAIIAPKKFTEQQKNAAYTCLPMGLCFITEGVLPFVAEDPIRVVGSCMVGSAVASGLAMAFGVGTPASHGGILVMPMSNKPLLWVLCCAIGSVITGVLYAVLKREPSKEEVKEEEVVDLDIDF